MDELFTDAAAREVREETGIEARAVEVIGLWHSLGMRESQVASANLYVICRMEVVEPRVEQPVPDGVEVDAAGFFSLEEIVRSEQVQSLSRWIAEQGLAGGSGLVAAPLTHPTRPGVVFGPKRGGSSERISASWPGWRSKE